MRTPKGKPFTTDSRVAMISAVMFSFAIFATGRSWRAALTTQSSLLPWPGAEIVPRECEAHSELGRHVRRGDGGPPGP
jgi:hypothetical protein